MSTVLAAALGYARRGWSVFPARVTIVEGRKHVAPLGLWRQVSTTDMLAITRWWGEGGECPDASVCIDTGKSGLVVVDPDGAEGIATWAKVVAENSVAATWRARTPGGGEHWYYAADLAHVVGNDSSGKVAPHVDVRGLGGFVIAPPSVDARGAYGWIEGEPDGALPGVPALVRERMGAKAAAERLAAPADVGGGEFGLAPRLFTMAQALEFCRESMAALASAPDGTINDRLNQAAKTLSHFTDVPGFWSREQATGWLLHALESTEYDGATWVAENTISSAFGSAAGDWRAALDEGEVSGPLVGPSQAVGDDVIERLRAELLTASEIVARPNPVPLVNGVLDLDSEAWLIGKPGSFKSFVALDLAGHVGRGEMWQGCRVHRGDVLYLIAEGLGGATLRVRAWEDAYGPMTGVRFLPRPVQAKSPEWGVLVELCRQDRPALIIIDTQARVTVGIEENSATELGLYLERVRRLREATGACVLNVHHIGRTGEDARGSSAMDGAQGTELRVHRPRPKELQAEILMDKQKDMADSATMSVELAKYDAGIDLETGRSLSSLVVKPLAPFAVPKTKVQRWIEDLPENQAQIIGVLDDHVGVFGESYARIKALVDERFGVMHKSSFSTAMKKLREPRTAELGPIVVKIKGSERYALASLFDDEE